MAITKSNWHNSLTNANHTHKLNDLISFIVALSAVIVGSSPYDPAWSKAAQLTTVID